jgi:hypothetical protein
VVTLRFRGVRPIDVSPYRLRRPRSALSRVDVTKRCALRYSDRPTCSAAEALERLSCSCAHFRVQPVVARLVRSTHLASGYDRPRRNERTVHGPNGSAGQLSWSLVPLRRVSPSESTPPRLANTGYVPSTGFYTLSTAYSSLGRPALFHAGNAHGVPPFREFPSLPGPAARHDEISLLAFLLRNGC